MAAEAMGGETHSVLSPDALDWIRSDSFDSRFAVESNTPVLGCVMERVDPLPCNFHTASLDCSPDMEDAIEGSAVAKEMEVQKDLVGLSLGRGGHALDNFQFRVKAKVENLLAGGEKALLRNACDVLIQEAGCPPRIVFRTCRAPSCSESMIALHALPTSLVQSVIYFHSRVVSPHNLLAGTSFVGNTSLRERGIGCGGMLPAG